MMCAAALVFVAGLASAGTIRHDVSDQAYLDLAASTAFDCVGKLTGYTSTSTYSASGVLIAPLWVLTAAHLVEDAVSLEFAMGAKTCTAQQWYVHEKWNRYNISNGYDIALVRIDAPPGAVPAQRYLGSGELGLIGTFVGFGKTGTGLTGAIISDGKKRAGQNVIDVATPSLGAEKYRVLRADFDNPTNPYDNRYGSSAPLQLEYLIASGDSGGGVFIDDGSGLKLAGIHSFGGAVDGIIDFDYGDFSGHTRVSMFNTWIDGIIGPQVPVSGDANGDGLVDSTDFSTLKTNFGRPGGWGEGDFNGDGLVDSQDFSILRAHFGEVATYSPGGGTAPEPATIAMLWLGACLGLSRFKRR
jgi:hypothetical protein